MTSTPGAGRAQFELGDIRRLLDAFERSDWDEVHLVADGVEVHISTAAGPATTEPAAPRAPQQRAEQPEQPAATDDATTDTEPESPTETDGHAIVSPSPGIFWRSPSPGEPPFVDVGHTVSPDTTVCIVEVMKLMNHVHAGVAGTVQAVLVENGTSVERGQPVVLVELDD